MQRIFYACLVLAGLFGRSASAQIIPNPGFEDWAPRNGVDSPTNWINTDEVLHSILLKQGYSGPVVTGSVTKITTAHSGTYAASLTTKFIPEIKQSFPAVLILGTKLGINNNSGGVPCTVRPAELQFYYQYTGPASDQPVVAVQVNKTTTTTPLAVGEAVKNLTPTTGGYQLVSMPLVYSSSATPDTISIIFVSSSGSLTAGSSLKIDDVALVGTALATRADAALQQQLSVSPNPSTDGRFRLRAPGAPALTSAPLTVLDMTGRVVRQQPALPLPNPERELDLSGLRAGLYLLRLDSKDGTLTRQLSIK